MRYLSPQDRASETERSRRLRPVLRQKIPEMGLKELLDDVPSGTCFRLICGHTTDYEVQLRVAVWRPSKGRYFCETCGKWVGMSPKPPRQPLPDEPMF